MIIKLNDKNNFMQPSCCLAFYILQSYLKKLRNFKDLLPYTMLLSLHKFVCTTLLLPNVGIYIRVSTRHVLQKVQENQHGLKVNGIHQPFVLLMF
jgi:hypothetical protein